MNREIPSSTLATLRGILVSSLSRENLGPHDLPVHEHTRHRPPRKVHFHEGKGEIYDEFGDESTRVTRVRFARIGEMDVQFFVFCFFCLFFFLH